MPEDCQSSVRRTVRAQYVFSDELPPGCPPFELPDGRMMMELELDDITYIVVRPGSMARTLLAELNRYADRVTRLGIWSRDPSRVTRVRALEKAAGR